MEEEKKFCEFCDSKGFKHKNSCPTLKQGGVVNGDTMEKVNTILVDAEKLQQLVNEFKAKDDKIAKLESLVERVTYAADKGRLMRWDLAHQVEKLPRVQVSTYDGKIVRGWEMRENFVEKNLITGVWIENQTIRVIFGDGDFTDLPYATFARHVKKVQGSVVGDISDAVNGSRILTIKLDDPSLNGGNELKMAVEFVN